MRVYKFLSKGWALTALRTRQLKIARLDELNDPFDLSPFDTSTHPANLMMTLTLDNMAKRFGFVCFSASWTNPVIWAHYAEQHRGMCLGFDVPDEYCKSVTYVPGRLPFPALETMTPDERFAAAQAFLFTKFSSWEYENEVRVSLRLDPATEVDGLYFKQFDEHLKLAEVIVGLRSGTCRREVERCLSHSDADCAILRAAAAPTGFSVIAATDQLRNHDDLMYYLKRGDTLHPVQFVDE
jgi:hypothetical protein